MVQGEWRMRFGHWESKRYLGLSAWALVITLRRSAALVLISAAAIGAGCTRSAPESERTIATRVMAEYVVKAAAPKAVLVISNPFTQQKGRAAEVYAFEEAGIDGLKQGFGDKVTVKVAFPKLKEAVLRDPASVPVDPQTTTPLSFLVTESAFSEVIQENRDCDLVVSLIGLPANLPAFKEWAQAGSPRFALLLPDWRMIGGRDEIRRAFSQKKLVAAVVNKPNAPAEAGTGEARAIFDRRFLLVTAENVEQLLNEYPAAFGLR